MHEIRPSDLLKRYLDSLPASLAAYCEGDGIAPAYRDQAERCPACDGPDLLPGVRKGSLHYARCAGCGSLFQSPALNAAALAHWYATSEAARLGEEIRRRTYQSRKTAKFGPIADRYARRLQDADLLDVGCSWGYFLELAREKYSARVEGIELNPDTAREVAERTGIPVHTRDLRQLEGMDGRFDTITCFGTLTHVAQPFSFLEACRRALRPGGALILSTPNCRGFEFTLGEHHESFQGTVLTLFSARGLAACLERAGFTPVVRCLGSRDVEVVRHMLARNPAAAEALPPFLRDLLADDSAAGEPARAELQEFITRHGLSGYMEALATTPGATS